MTRIQPECFIECYKHGKNNIKHYKYWVTDDTKPEFCSPYVVALFLIKPTKIPLTERLEARKVNNNLKLAI
jgi:hypothetical protein